ncbi:hypothetical protein M3Y95_00556100 [Aphelenchoides besseyi]|nr:hypothetical protein M3Y95_00556100 [Aphelenchoides besseyi]
MILRNFLVLLFQINCLLALNSTVNSGEVTQVSNETLEQKVFRLRLLKTEVKALAAEIRQYKANKPTTADEEKWLSQSRFQRFKQWKRRVQERLSHMAKKLNRLEKAIQTKNTTNVQSRKNWRRPPLRTTTLLPVTNLKHLGLRDRGEHENNCEKHLDCKPGHCCQKHESGLRCMRFMLSEGDTCRDSCACASLLHCFKSNVTIANGPQSIYCKRPESADLDIGIYLNNQNSNFT